jgi:hypothetical protein
MEDHNASEGLSYVLSSNLIVDSFQNKYTHLEGSVRGVLTDSSSNPFLIERVGNALDDYIVSFGRVSLSVCLPCIPITHPHPSLTKQFSHLFGGEEADTIWTNIGLFGAEINHGYSAAVESSHHGRPHPVTAIATGCAGHPGLIIDQEWLTWAVEIRNTSEIACYLGISWPIMRDALLEYGLSEPADNPFIRTYYDPNTLQPSLSYHSAVAYTQVRSYHQPVSDWSDEELDNAITRLWIHYPSAGVAMLQGSLEVLGQRVKRSQISESLIHVEPDHQLFGQLVIERRGYRVPGPNFLWHHDGQHG